MGFWVLFAIVAYYNLDINQIDIKTAFLYGLYNQLIYVKMPKGTKTNTTRDMIYKLEKTLYNLKQSPRLWYKRLSSFLLEKLDFYSININHNIFITSTSLNQPIVNIFVDDIKIMAIKRSGFIKKVKVKLTSAFQIADIGPISFYLDFKVEQNREKKAIKLSQLAYIKKIFCKFFLDQANPSHTPMRESVQFLPNNSGKKAINTKQEKYQGMTKLLIFSIIETRLDIAFATSVVSRFRKNPSYTHIESVKTILKYLKRTKKQGIIYGQGTLAIERYSNSD